VSRLYCEELGLSFCGSQYAASRDQGRLQFLAHVEALRQIVEQASVPHQRHDQAAQSRKEVC
jgi:hypothetical protein